MSELRNSTSRDPVIPDKLYFRIGEVARLLDVEAHTLRFWETEFAQLKVGKGGTGQRLYRRRDVELAFTIKRLLYNEGYTIAGARQFLQNQQRRKAVDATVRPEPETADNSRAARLERLRKDLRDLSALLGDAPGSHRASSRPQTHSAAPPRHAGSQGRRGLHLAARTPVRPAPLRHLPGLFED